MLAAVMNGDAKKLAELIGQSPYFNVNMVLQLLEDLPRKKSW